jgi:uncharacterized protein
MPGYEFLLVAGISAAVGAIVQSGIGLGLGLVAETGPMIRATLSIFFTVSAMISVGTLAAVHRLPERQVMAGLALTPFVIVGFAVSGPLRRYLDGGRMRSAVLIVTGMSALTLIIRSVV